MGTETGAVTMTAGHYLLALMWLLSAPFVWGALARLLRAGIPNWVLRHFFCSILTAAYWFLSILAVGLGGIVPALSWFIALAFGGIIALAIAIMRGWTPLKASPPLVTASYPPVSLPPTPAPTSAPTPAPTPAPDRGVTQNASRYQAIVQAYRDDDDDEDEASGWLNEYVAFAYVNAAGEHSEREVRVSKAWPERFSGYCYLRQKRVTFRYDRIVGDIIRIDTGELVSVEKWRKSWLKQSAAKKSVSDSRAEAMP